VTVEWDFTDPNKVKDWSVVAYGAKGGISVKHPTWTTASLPYIPRTGTSTNNNTYVPPPAPTPTPTPTPTPSPTDPQSTFVAWADTIAPTALTAGTCTFGF